IAGSHRRRRQPPASASMTQLLVPAALPTCLPTVFTPGMLVAINSSYFPGTCRRTRQARGGGTEYGLLGGSVFPAGRTLGTLCWPVFLDTAREGFYNNANLPACFAQSTPPATVLAGSQFPGGTFP